ncbi:hypothetical protein TNCV_5132901 [Trichonephila clavipes]|nr:hypothetical protein TNCV_5132901 [Trichonephila clavipes]
MSSSLVLLKNRRVGGRCTLNLWKLKRPPVGVVWKLRDGGEIPVQMSSSLFDHGSKLQGPPPKAFEQLDRAMVIFTHPMKWLPHLKICSVCKGLAAKMQLNWKKTKKN